jgi:phage baseplate assembly protein W
MAIRNNRIDQFIEDKDTRVSVGIDFPFTLVPNKDGYFKTTKTTVDSIKNNIKMLLQTEQNERVFQPNLGMRIRSLLFEPMTEDITIEIENDIVNTFEKWLPYVDLKDIQISNNDNNQLDIKIVFDIGNTPSLLPTRELQTVEVSFVGVGAGTDTDPFKTTIDPVIPL